MNDTNTRATTLFARTERELSFTTERNEGRKAEGEELPQKECDALLAINDHWKKAREKPGEYMMRVATLYAVAKVPNAHLILSWVLLRDINAFLHEIEEV